MVRLGVLIGLPSAVISTIYLIVALVKNKSSLKPLLIVIVGIVCSIPYFLCEFYGEETVNTTDVRIYEKEDSYIFEDTNKAQYVLIEEDGMLIKRVVQPTIIKRIVDNSYPKLQVVTTYKNFSIFEISSEVHIIWIPEIN